MSVFWLQYLPLPADLLRLYTTSCTMMVEANTKTAAVFKFRSEFSPFS